MPNVLIKQTQIKGLIPLLDRRQVAEPFVVSGRNFLVDAEGPYAAFGNELLSQIPLVDFIRSKTFNVANEIFIFTNSAVLIYDAATFRYIPILTYTPITTQGLWYMELVGGLYYFVHIGVGLLQYNATTQTWVLLTSNVPTGVRDITQAYSRLIVLGIGLVAWSAIDNGADLATSTVTGAGSQSLSLVGGGEGLAVYKTTLGFTTYTKTGLMKSEAITSINPFRHTVLTQDKFPVSAFAITPLGVNTQVFMTASGLFKTEGELPEPWQPIVGEYFHRTVLPQLDLEDTRQVWLNYISDADLFLISLSNSAFPDKYEEAFVLYIPKDEWGMFNRTHVAIGDFWALDEDPDRGFTTGFVDNTGFVRKFSETPHVEDVITQETGNYFFRDLVEYRSYYNDGVVIANSLAKMVPIDEDYFNNISQFYLTDYISTLQLVPRVFGSVDSIATVGLYHYTDQQYEDTIALITDIVVGVKPLNAVAGDEDWLTSVAPDEDWLVLTGNEDWGFGAIGSIDYSLVLTGSLDGYSQWEDQVETLIELESDGSYDQFAANVNGINHLLTFDATEVNQSFQLKLLGVSGIITGRL